MLGGTIVSPTSPLSPAPLNDDRLLGRGFRVGGDFLQFLVKGGKVGWTLFTLHSPVFKDVQGAFYRLIVAYCTFLGGFSENLSL
jgi:hypothetical protein